MQAFPRSVHPALQEELIIVKSGLSYRLAQHIDAILAMLAELAIMAFFIAMRVAPFAIFGIPYLFVTVTNVAYGFMRKEKQVKCCLSLRIPLLVVSILLYLPAIYPIIPIGFLYGIISSGDAPFWLFFTAFLLIYIQISTFLSIMTGDYRKAMANRLGVQAQTFPPQYGQQQPPMQQMPNAPFYPQQQQFQGGYMPIPPQAQPVNQNPQVYNQV